MSPPEQAPAFRRGEHVTEREEALLDRWDVHFLQQALLWSTMSKDPNTRVGAVIAGPDRTIRTSGFNGFPRGIADSVVRLTVRDTKLRLMVHAERNAICSAARNGIATSGCTLYIAATDDSGLVWGGPPCTACTIELIQAGITRVIAYRQKSPSKWHDDLMFARSLLSEAGVSYRELGATDAGPSQIHTSPA
jgi:dCMP deaminase